jgi:N-sulfoglucosamine sulfohydrolase
MKSLFFTLVLLTISTLAQNKPNILWISVEDMSPTLGCYGDRFANTPNIDLFATKSNHFMNAFATAPVCAPSRSCLINGLPASSQGTQNMRSFQKIPTYMTGFPTLLRQAGYYTTNNVKTDYNSALWKTIIDKSWDESSDKAHWRNKPNDKPFFSVFNLMTTHQSRTMVWPYKDFIKSVQNTLRSSKINSPEKVPLPPYYPNTAIVRKTQARFYDCVAAMDKQVGTLLEQLKADGLSEDTIVFFFSDHGSGMPRHKRALLDSGMKVPLLIHLPKKYQHLNSLKPKPERLVNFADFAPTVLSMAGIKAPDYMEGKDIYRKNGDDRQFIFGHRDRVDEVRDMARSVRGRRYLYIRNFMPHLGYNQTTGWPDKGSIRHEFYALKNSPELSPSLRHFISPTRTVEELYDCKNDPQNLNNLAKHSEHQTTLENMRAVLKNEMLQKKDLGVFPEADINRITTEKPMYEKLRETDLNYKEIVDQLFKVGVSTEEVYTTALNSKSGTIRYWALIGLSRFKSFTASTLKRLEDLLQDEYDSVRIEAAALLHGLDQRQEAVQTLLQVLSSNNYSAKLHACRAIELTGSQKFEDGMKLLAEETKDYRVGPATLVRDGDADLALFLGLSLNAYFKKISDSWQPLFNGKDLEGWHYTTPGEVKVENGSISILAKKKNLWLQTKKTFRDFELKIDIKMPPSGYNSGIGFRCTTTGKLHGFQCEIDQEKTGAIYAIGKGWVYPPKKDGWGKFTQHAGDCYKPAVWNKLHIICQGENIKVFVNGYKTTDVKSSAFKEGSIALQHHGKGDIHYFKNILIKELK